MKSIVVFFLIGLVSASTWAEDSQNIKELYKRWAEAVEEADIDSYVSVLHPQVKLMPPQSDPFCAHFLIYMGSKYMPFVFNILYPALPRIPRIMRGHFF